MKILLTAILTLLLFTGCEEKIKNNSDTVTKQESQQESNGITLKDTTGKEIKVTTLENGFIFKGYENKIVLLNFFATWCSFMIEKELTLNTI